MDARLSLGPFQVSPICLGVTARPEVVVAAFDAGINFFFVSGDLHWPLYEPMRRGLEALLSRGGGIRDDIVVAAASYLTQPEFGSIPFRELLDNVKGLGRLDILVAGGAYGHEIGTRLPVYVRHREQAFCGARAIGASFHDRVAAAAEANRGAVDLVLARYNALHPGASKDLFPHVGQRHARLFNFSNLRGYVYPAHIAKLGLDPETWVPAVADHYRYSLSRSEVDGVLCRLDKEEYLVELMDAIDEGPLSAEEATHLELLAKLAYGALATG